MIKTPERMCIVCRIQRPKKELLRIVKSKEGNIFLDFIGKKPGRGAYICDNKDCIEKCIKNNILNRAFDMQIDKEIYANILKEYDQHKN